MTYFSRGHEFALRVSDGRAPKWGARPSTLGLFASGGRLKDGEILSAMGEWELALFESAPIIAFMQTLNP